MRNRLDTVRYGTPCFTYLVSLLIYSDISADICHDAVSLASFVIFSSVLAFTLLGVHNLTYMYGNCPNVIKLFPIFAILFSVVYEIIKIHRVFQNSSDFTSSRLGLYVLALIIISISSICSSGGAYTAIKVSNIIYIIPCVVFILVFASVISGGISPDIPSIYGDSFLSSILRGFFSSLILCADVFIIISMQKREKCYSRKEMFTSVIVALLLTVVSSVMLRWLFGAALLQSLDLPFISAVGIIPGFSFDEIMTFAVSVCILYRFICKQSFCELLIGEVFRTSLKPARVFCFVIFSLLGILGTHIYVAGMYGNVIFMAVSLLNLIAFVLLPLTVRKKDNR